MPKTKKTSTLKFDRKLIILGSIAGILVLIFAVIQILNLVTTNNRSANTVFSSKAFLSAPMMDSSSFGNIEEVSLDLVAEAPSLIRQKIDTASLVLLVDNVSDSINNIKNVTLGVDGYITNSNIYENGDDLIQGNITIRIPSENFESILNQIKSLAVKVENESTSSDDVTEQIIDIETRIENLEILEEQYRKILKTATKTEDVLKITREINNVRQQIESFEGQLKYINEAVSMSTISVNLKAIADVQVFGLTWKPLIILKQALRNMVAGILDYVETIIYLIFYIPVIAVWLTTIGVVILGGYKLVLFILSKFKKRSKK